MRLSSKQSDSILDIVASHAGSGAAVYLFGSQVDDRRRGGDIDLLIETERVPDLVKRAKIKLEIESQLGLPVDIVARGRDQSPTAFQLLARSQARRLETQP